MLRIVLQSVEVTCNHDVSGRQESNVVHVDGEVDWRSDERQSQENFDRLQPPAKMELVHIPTTCFYWVLFLITFRAGTSRWTGVVCGRPNQSNQFVVQASNNVSDGLVASQAWEKSVFIYWLRTVYFELQVWICAWHVDCIINFTFTLSF